MESVDLARRVVACLRWRWMDGMRALDGDRKCGFRLTENSGLPGHPDPVVDDSWTPDLSDPATLGCLLALVREAWGPHAETGWDGSEHESEWSVRLVDYTERDGVWYLSGCRHIGVGATEAAALIAALEAAP